ncbi:DUF1740-domain-containing protein [Xylariaceae sp. FL1019]|nr:DUF1740-domain-containing protein [Xylariaceae sp. FL1019]
MPSYERKTKSVVPSFSSFKKPTTSSLKSGNANAAHSHSTSSHPSLSSSRARNSSSQQRPSAPPSTSSLYVVDKRGDSLVRRYGTNDRNEIPSYRRIGNGRVMGVDGYMRIEKCGNHDQFSMPNYYEARPILSNDKKTLLAKGISTSSRPVYIRQKTSENQDPAEDYVPLNTSEKRKREDDASNDDGEETSYRDIHGKSKTREHFESDGQSQSDYSGDEAATRADPMTIRSIELSRKTRGKPDDIHAWVELVHHRSASCGARAPTAAEVKSFSDIKLSLLDQALSHVEGRRERRSLILKRMQEGIKVWDTRTALKQFSDVMQIYPEDLELWTLHLAFQQATPSLFTFSEIKQRYVDKLTSLRAIMHTSDYGIQAIHVFLRLTVFLLDAGFADLASAAWSATLDMNFSKPHGSPDMLTGSSGPLAMQEFWEAEVPRMGEDQWQGCAAFSKDANNQQAPDPKLSITGREHMPETRDGYRAWYFMEQHRASNATLPARTLDDGAEDDPFRVVMYTDFQDFLLELPTEILAHARGQLINAFLIFCELPPAIGQNDESETGMRVVALNPLIARCDQMNLGLDANHPNEQNTGDYQRRVPVFPPTLHQVQPSPEVIFPSQKWQCYLGEMRSKIPVDKYRWISTILKQLIRMGNFSEIRALKSFLLAFQMTNEPDDVKKSAKSLLKQDPWLIDLYLGYATAESERGHQAAAENVLSAAIRLPQLDIIDQFRLGVSAAWLKLTGGNLNGAILELCRLETRGSQSRPEDLPLFEYTEASSSQILKARRFLTRPRDKARWPGAFCNQHIFNEAFVLFEYLTGRSDKEPRSAKQGDISSAIIHFDRRYDSCVQFPESKGTTDEEFFQFAARLLYYHASHGSFRPSLFREQITKYLNLFPSNSIFLALFAWQEERLSVNDRVRSLLQSHVLTRPHETLPSHLFAINYEIQTGNVHSIRAAFERAVISDACAHHPGLWIAYIRFCHGRKELRKKSKGVFARAIQACPWAKNVYMEAFGTLCRDMDSTELKGVYNTMYEKGLRIFVDLHEFVEEWRRDHGNREKEG